MPRKNDKRLWVQKFAAIAGGLGIALTAVGVCAAANDIANNDGQGIFAVLRKVDEIIAAINPVHQRVFDEDC